MQRKPPEYEFLNLKLDLDKLDKNWENPDLEITELPNAKFNQELP